jgi:uncharacterized iron-regulated protein
MTRRALPFVPLLALLGCALAACSAAREGTRVEKGSDPASALLRRASRLFDGKSFAELSWEEALDRLAKAEVVFLGETHLDQLTHDAELELLRGLTLRRGGRVTLSMEMFERDVQPAVDDYLAGRIDETAFLARSRPWGNYATDYRPLVEFARRESLPLVAANLPALLRQKLARGGQAAFDALSPAERACAPARLIENPPAYWERVENVTRGHGALGPSASGTSGAGEHLFDGQNLWDNTMADAIALERAKRPDRLVVHVCGGFHMEHRQGTVWQLEQRAPGVAIATLSIEATSDVAGESPDDPEPRADLLLAVESRARSEQEGAAAVVVAHEQHYRLTVPPHSVGADRPLPLLVWLCDDGESPDDGIALWQPLLGRECALLALEPNHPFAGEEGVRRGRWYFAGKADEGGGEAAAAVERALEVVTRDEPGGGAPALRIDRDRVVVAGERAGGAMAFCAARFAGRAKFDALAFAPAAQDELELLALPLPPGRSRPPRRLTILDRDERRAAWSELTARDGELRITTAIEPFPSDLAAAERAEVDRVRGACGLAPLPADAAAEELLKPGSPALATPRGRLFARVLSRRVRAAGSHETPSLAITAAAFADGTRLPLSSGPFGGTTIVVVDDAAGEQELAAWMALESPDVLQKSHRFHRLRIAHGSGDHSPRAVIERLRAENPQRRDFLVVPAAFCVDDAALRALRAGLGPLADELHLELLPGLGDRLGVGERPHGEP